MYDLFKRPATRFTGAMTYPQLAYLNRHFQTQVRDVKKFYYLHPKFVDAKNALGNLLIHIPIRTDLDDQRYSRYVEDMSSGVSRAFGFTSPVYRGKVHESGVVLGPRTNEVVITISTQVDVTNFDREWYKASAVRCLYHTRTDLGLPVLNNTTPGAGWGVTTVDIPMLALQYRYWLKYQVDHMEQKESVYRFIGGFVLPNMIDSYLDIAFFNRLARYSKGVGIPKHPTPHPFYLTDHSSRVQRLCSWILEHQERRSGDIEQVVNTTPVLLERNLWSVMRLPRDPVTRANEWALQLARLPYVRYIVETSVNADKGDRSYLNELYVSLVDASRDNIFNGVGSPDVVKQYRSQIRSLIELLESKKQGWT